MGSLYSKCKLGKGVWLNRKACLDPGAALFSKVTISRRTHYRQCTPVDLIRKKAKVMFNDLSLCLGNQPFFCKLQYMK